MQLCRRSVNTTYCAFQTEQIRRTNRLWASDSLFLREHLLIPVDGEAGATYNGGASGSNEPALSRGSSVVDRDEEETSIGDFLGKIDSSIAVTKSEVNKCQGNSE